MPLTQQQKRNFLNSIAEKTGSARMSLQSVGIHYSDYKDHCNTDTKFEQNVKEAEQFFIQNVNHYITTMSKKRHAEILMHGVRQITTVTEDIKDLENSVIATKQKITIRELGVPVAAIKLGYELIPEQEKSIAALITQNALSKTSLERVQAAALRYQAELREAVSGEVEEKVLTSQIIAAIQQSVIGGSDF